MAEALIIDAQKCFSTQSLKTAEARLALIEKLGSLASPLADAWGLALAIQGETAGHGRVGEDVKSRLHAFRDADEDTRVVAFVAAKEAAQASILRWDLGGLREWHALSVAMAEGVDSPVASVGLRLMEGWLSWFEGRYSAAPLAASGSLARKSAMPAYVVEAKALEALHFLAEGDIGAATTAARLASRMARSEGIPDVEVLANIVLARVRRFQDRPHLALLILAGLAPHAPPAWRGWMEWEAVFSGALSVHGLREESMANALIQVVDAARRGDAEGARAFAAELRERAEVAPFARDADDALGLLLPGEDASPSMLAWRRGDRSECPAGVVGVAFAGAGSSTKDTACAHIVVGADGKSSRIPAISAPLASALLGADPAPAAGPTRPRSDTGLAVMALAGEPIEVGAYFREVYGFDFDTTVHASMLTMHAQRMRQRLGDAGDVLRNDGTLLLQPKRAMLLRDPRCEEPLAQRVLRIIATTGRRGAGDLAKELGVPLRTIQRALKELHAMDDVVLVKAGRSVGYQVEDTTFSEPTRSRKFEGALVVV